MICSPSPTSADMLRDCRGAPGNGRHHADVTAIFTVGQNWNLKSYFYLILNGLSTVWTARCCLLQRAHRDTEELFSSASSFIHLFYRGIVFWFSVMGKLCFRFFANSFILYRRHVWVLSIYSYDSSLSIEGKDCYFSLKKRRREQLLNYLRWPRDF